MVTWFVRGPTVNSRAQFKPRPNMRNTIRNLGSNHQKLLLVIFVNFTESRLPFRDGGARRKT